MQQKTIQFSDEEKQMLSLTFREHLEISLHGKTFILPENAAIDLAQNILQYYAPDNAAPKSATTSVYEQLLGIPPNDNTSTQNGEIDPFADWYK